MHEDIIFEIHINRFQLLLQGRRLCLTCHTGNENYPIRHFFRRKNLINQIKSTTNVIADFIQIS